MRDFTLVTTNGRWINGSVVDLKVLDLTKKPEYIPPKEEAESFKKQLKLAFSVGLKISKKAVVRNRLRRQLREAVRLIFKADIPQEGFFVLVVPKKDACTAEFSKIFNELSVLLRRAGVVKMK